VRAQVSDSVSNEDRALPLDKAMAPNKPRAEVSLLRFDRCVLVEPLEEVLDQITIAFLRIALPSAKSETFSTATAVHASYRDFAPLTAAAKLSFKWEIFLLDVQFLAVSQLKEAHLRTQIVVKRSLSSAT